MRFKGARALIALWLCGLLSASAAAQRTSDDAAAREYFERGRSAFADADYERALVYFRQAYRLSGRGALQYNIGITADRLQRDGEALFAFERYLEEAVDRSREVEVKERIVGLQQSIAQKRATERALAEAIDQSRVTTADTRATRKLPTSSIVGGSVLSALGVAGVAAMGVGIARDGSCDTTGMNGCETRRETTGWTWVYGALGMAAVAGGTMWFALGARRAKRAKATTEVAVAPAGVTVRGRF